MDGLIEFLFFAGFVAVCIFIDKMNNAVKKAPKSVEEPMPEVLEIPVPPTVSVKKVKPQQSAKRATRTKYEDITQREQFKSEGVRSTVSPLQTIETTPRSEYAINSVEEARKAIIWSEILNRKY